jgi:hypothetical protein
MALDLLTCSTPDCDETMPRSEPDNAITRAALRMGNQTFEHKGWLFRVDNDGGYEQSWCPSHWPAVDPI